MMTFFNNWKFATLKLVDLVDFFARFFLF